MLTDVPNWVVVRVNCDAGDNYPRLWRKAFKDIIITRPKPALGFTAVDTTEHQSLVEQLPELITPDDVRRTLGELSKGVTLLIIFDEFDRLTKTSITGMMADTIKALSDYGVGATVLLIGVADSVDELISGHQSIERALVQIPMPRMSADEVREVVRKGLNRLAMTIAEAACEELVSLSQGLPYITHLLAGHAAKAAISRDATEIATSDVEAGIKQALGQWQQSVITSYIDAVKSPQPGNIYKPVLLACALAETDELGYFTAAAVRTPLRIITGRDYDIPNFAQHLKNFSDDTRGHDRAILQRVGETRRIRYRFASPLMRPYIVMRGFSEGLIKKSQMNRIPNS